MVIAGIIWAITGLGVAMCIVHSFSWTIVLLTLVTILIQGLIFLTFRHLTLMRYKYVRRWSSTPTPLGSGKRHDDYHLFVLGSGGHTKEMLMMMDDGACDFRGFHRRYLISSGDTMSANHMRDYEVSLAGLCAAKGTESGTHDVVRVTRARRVHQSILTTPFTALRSVLDILPALLSKPEAAGRKYPSLVFSNGPATGFFVAVAIHLLKIFHVVPEASMKFVYIESWARISTLSLTGKLFYHTGLADFFSVQHKDVAEKYGIKNVGQMVFNARREDI